MFLLAKYIFLLLHLISIFFFIVGFFLFISGGLFFTTVGLFSMAMWAYTFFKFFYHKTIVFQENEAKITQIDFYSIRRNRVLIIKFGKNLSENTWRLTARSPAKNPDAERVDLSFEGSLK